MQDFQVNVYPLRDKNFLTSFVHPLTKRKVRQNFSSRLEAQEYSQQVEARFKRPKPENFRELTIEELVVYFMSERPQNNHFVRSKRHLFDFIETFGQFKIDDLTTDAFRVWLDQIQRENGLKDITMRGLKCQIDTLFAFLEEKEVISESPLSRIYYEKIAPPLKARNLLSEEDIEKLLTAIQGYSPGYLFPIVKMFVETGAKVVEVIELGWKDVDLQNGIIHFRSREKSQERKLKISNELVSDLAKKKRQSTTVFLTYYKEPFTRSKLTRAVNEFKDKELYKGEWGPLDLRHSYAVNFLARGGDMRELQRILGHNNVFDTKRLYGEAATEKAARDVANPFQ